MVCSVVSNMAATTDMWPLNTCKEAVVTKEVNL